MYRLPVSPASHTLDHFLFSLPGQGPQIIINQTSHVTSPWRQSLRSLCGVLSRLSEGVMIFIPNLSLQGHSDCYMLGGTW